MIYLPSMRERYTAALRRYVQKCALAGGITVRTRRNLKRIYAAEAYFTDRTPTPEDAVLLADIILGSAIMVLSAKGKSLSAEFSGGGVYLINKKAYILLLLSLAEKSEKIRLSASGGGISIEAYGTALPRCGRAVKALGGVCLRVSSGERAVFFIPAQRTDAEPCRTENEWFYLTDSFSPVNIFLRRD